MKIKLTILFVLFSGFTLFGQEKNCCETYYYTYFVAQKHKLKIFPLFILTLLIFSSFTASAKDTTKLAVFLKFHPIAAININRPSLLGSVELRLNGKFGISLGYGKRYLEYLTPPRNPLDTLTTQFRGETKMAELMMYNILQSKKIHGGVLNLGLSYRYVTDVSNAAIYYWSAKDSSLLPRTPKADYYALTKKIHIIGIKAVAIQPLKYNFFLEYFGEIGIRHKNQRVINNEFDPDNDTFSGGLYPIIERPYYGYLPTLNLGVKITYKII